MNQIDWTITGDFQDIQYHKAEGIAKITINRPEVRNAFRPLTVKEMSDAFTDAREDPEIGVVILTGKGKDAFCSGVILLTVADAQTGRQLYQTTNLRQ